MSMACRSQKMRLFRSENPTGPYVDAVITCNGETVTETFEVTVRKSA